MYSAVRVFLGFFFYSFLIDSFIFGVHNTHLCIYIEIDTHLSLHRGSLCWALDDGPRGEMARPQGVCGFKCDARCRPTDQRQLQSVNLTVGFACLQPHRCWNPSRFKQVWFT